MVENSSKALSYKPSAYLKRRLCKLFFGVLFTNKQAYKTSTKNKTCFQ